ncbi:MAG: uroporphyrinogen decarboxylase family protein [Victivallales bacterium]
MNAKERILTTLSHREPELAPFAWGFGPTREMSAVLEKFCTGKGISWKKLRELSGDITGVGPGYTGKMPPGGNTSTDLWGIKRKKMNYGGGEYEEFTDFPLAGFESTGQLDRYPWPDPLAYDYGNFRQNLLSNPLVKEKAVNLSSGNPFEIYCWMTGLEDALVNTIVNPGLVKCALEHITGFFEKKLELCMKEAGDLIDIVFIADDLGSQNGLLISRESYREIIQPFHRRLTSCAKKSNPRVKVMFHSDGAVFDILPDLMDAGIDIHEAVQTDAAGMEPERLKSAYGDRLCFHGAISVQSLLPHGDARTVRDESARLVKVLGKNGGYIPAPSHAVQIGTPPENVFAMMEGVLGKERFEEYLKLSEI